MSTSYDAGTINVTGNCVTWKIRNFYLLPHSEGSEIRSREFPFARGRYTLGIWPRGRKGVAYGWFGICLYNYSGSENNDLNSVEFSIVLGAEDVKTCTVMRTESNTWHSCLKFMKWTDFDANSDYLAPNGCLTVVCRFNTENSGRFYAESDRKCIQPLQSPPIKFQLGEYNSPNYSSGIASNKRSGAAEQVSSYPASGSISDSPSTINSFHSVSYVGEPSESTETQKTISKISSDAENDTAESSGMQILNFVKPGTEKASQDIDISSGNPTNSGIDSSGGCRSSVNSPNKTFSFWRMLLLCCSSSET